MTNFYITYPRYSVYLYTYTNSISSSQMEQEVVGEVGQLPLMLRAMVAIGEPRAHHHAPRFNKMGMGRLMPPPHAADISGGE